MILKLIGGTLILTGGFLVGYRIAASLKKRMHELIEIKRMLLFLQSEIEYNMTPLQQAFQTISGKMQEPVSMWLVSLSENMNESKGKLFSEIWVESLSCLSDKSFLKKKDIRMLSDLGKSLGYLDLKQQMGGIDLCDKILETEINHARESLPGKIKTVISISVLGSIMLVLTLL